MSNEGTVQLFVQMLQTNGFLQKYAKRKSQGNQVIFVSRKKFDRRKTHANYKSPIATSSVGIHAVKFKVPCKKTHTHTEGKNYMFLISQIVGIQKSNSRKLEN